MINKKGKKSILLHFKEEHYNKLKELANENDEWISELIRIAIQEYLSKNTSM